MNNHTNRESVTITAISLGRDELSCMVDCYYLLLEYCPRGSCLLRLNLLRSDRCSSHQDIFKIAPTYPQPLESCLIIWGRIVLVYSVVVTSAFILLGFIQAKAEAPPIGFDDRGTLAEGLISLWALSLDTDPLGSQLDGLLSERLI